MALRFEKLTESEIRMQLAQPKIAPINIGITSKNRVEDQSIAK
jgi:hypothetical protein